MVIVRPRTSSLPTRSKHRPTYDKLGPLLTEVVSSWQAHTQAPAPVSGIAQAAHCMGICLLSNPKAAPPHQNMGGGIGGWSYLGKQLADK
jgi:hypothetical protein